jgi:hypothetical protein
MTDGRFPLPPAGGDRPEEAPKAFWQAIMSADRLYT